MSDSTYDVLIIGNYTKDTIVSAEGTRVVDGGGFNYAAHVTAMMGFKTAAITRLSRSDEHVVDQLLDLGIAVFPTYTSHSTCLRLFYPTRDPDERVLSVTDTAGPFTLDQIRGLAAKASLITGSLRGEVSLEIVHELRAKSQLLAADVQAFFGIQSPDGALIYADWPERFQVLAQLDILKADSTEAGILTGEADLRKAARILTDWGPKEIVLTRRDGVLVFASGRFYEAPFCPEKLVGRSGRGDTCIGAYLARRLSASPEDATLWAAAVTSLKLEAEGPIKRQLHEVEEWIRDHAAHTCPKE